MQSQKPLNQSVQDPIFLYWSRGYSILRTRRFGVRGGVSCCVMFMASQPQHCLKISPEGIGLCMCVEDVAGSELLYGLLDGVAIAVPLKRLG